MRLVRFDTVEGFRAAVEPFLVQREAEENLMLGICADLVHGVTFGQEQPYCALVESDGAVVAAVMRTPPHNVLLSHTAVPETLPLFVDDLHAEYGSLPGAGGPVDLSAAFSTLWQARTGQPYRLAMAQRIYRLERVTPPTGVPGRLRPATADDRELLVEWFAGFNRDTGGASGADAVSRAEAVVARYLGAAGGRALYLWVDGVPVSVAGYAGLTPHGVRVGAVYTPPDKRRRGYAGACVAAVSQLLLDGGRRFCFLYTDLANPTSNHIYQEIGYRPVCDVSLYHFGEAAR